MTDINSVTLAARLTRDVELRYTSGGTAITTLGVAVNRSVKQGDQWVEQASFFDVQVFGKTAENVQKYCKKGSQIFIQGSLVQQRWEKDGVKYSKVVISAHSIQFASNNAATNQNPAAPSQTAPQQNTAALAERAGAFPEDIPYDTGDDMDIPF